jgi:hypothetical protein
MAFGCARPATGDRLARLKVAKTPDHRVPRCAAGRCLASPPPEVCGQPRVRTGRRDSGSRRARAAGLPRRRMRFGPRADHRRDAQPKCRHARTPEGRMRATRWGPMEVAELSLLLVPRARASSRSSSSLAQALDCLQAASSPGAVRNKIEEKVVPHRQGADLLLGRRQARRLDRPAAARVRRRQGALALISSRCSRQAGYRSWRPDLPDSARTSPTLTRSRRCLAGQADPHLRQAGGPRLLPQSSAHEIGASSRRATPTPPHRGCEPDADRADRLTVPARATSTASSRTTATRCSSARPRLRRLVAYCTVDAAADEEREGAAARRDLAKPAPFYQLVGRNSSRESAPSCSTCCWPELKRRRSSSLGAKSRCDLRRRAR